MQLSIKQQIWQVVALIPEGRVATYGQIARLAGYPSHARFVGTTLHDLPANTRLPWHRVVNAQGRLSFPENSDSYHRQRRLLEQEGVVFASGKLSLKSYGWMREQ